MNTLKYAKKLEEVGFSREQAEMTIGILNEVAESKLATKQDLKDLAIATKQDIRDVRNELHHEIQKVRHEIQQLKSELTIKLGAMMVTAIGVVSVIVKLL